MSIKQEKRKKNIKGIVITIIAAAVIVAVALAVIEVQTGRFSAFEQRAENYYYSSDSGSAYSSVSDGLAVASSTGLQVFSKNGVQTLNETYIMTSPAMDSGGKNAVVYDIGGNTVKIFTVDSILQNIKTEGAVISARMSSKGWTALCTEETGYQGAVYVYNSRGVLAYKWLSGSSYVLAACVSPDSNYLAVLCVSSAGTKIVSLKLNDEDYIEETVIDGEILVDVGYDNDGGIYGISGSAIYHISTPGEAESIYSYNGMHLADYSIQGNVVLALDEHKSGGACNIISVSPTGAAETITSQSSGIVSLAVSSKYTAVLSDTKIEIYDTKKNALSAEYDATAYVKIITYDDGTVIAASRHWADAYSASGK